MSSNFQVVSLNTGITLDMTVFMFFVLSTITIRFAIRARAKVIVPRIIIIMLSCLAFGVVIVHIDTADMFLAIDEQFIFLIFIPPLLMEPSYHLTSNSLRSFGYVTLYAFLIALFTILIVGISLYLCRSMYSTEMTLFQSFLIACAVTASDPVSDLLLFQDHYVRASSMRTLVLMEAIMHAPMTILFMNLYDKSSKTTIYFVDIIYSILYFFMMLAVGLIIGFLVSLFFSFIYKYTGHIEVVEPMLLILGAYLSYIAAEAAYGAPSVSVLVYIIFTKKYAIPGLSQPSQKATKAFLGGLAQFDEIVILVLVGINFASVYFTTSVRDVDFVFIAFVLLFVCTGRFSAVFLVGRLLNYTNYNNVLTVAVTGIRSGISFCLASLFLRHTNLLVFQKCFNATLIVIVFTIIFNGSLFGSTLKQSNLLRKRKHKQRNLTLIAFFKVAKNIVNGVKVIARHGDKANSTLHRAHRKLKSLLIRSAKNNLRMVLIQKVRKAQIEDMKQIYIQQDAQMKQDFDRGENQSIFEDRRAIKRVSNTVVHRFDTQALRTLATFYGALFHENIE